MPDLAHSPDPLENIQFLQIPGHLVPALADSVDPDIAIPFEKKPGGASVSDISLESMIAGMLRILIYAPNNANAPYYASLVRALRPNIKEEFTEAGTIKARLKDFPVAIEIFKALIALFPDCPATQLNLALVLHEAALSNKQNKELYDHYTQEAFQAYQAALHGEDVFAETHLNYGYFLLEQDNYEKALAHFEFFLKHEPDQTKTAPVEKITEKLREITTQDVLFKEAFDRISLGDEETGILKARELVKKNPGFWNGWFLLGWGLRRLGRFAEAKETFLKSLELTDPKPDLLNELAIAHMELGELDASYQRLVEAIKLEPENIKVLSNLGIVSLKQNRIDDAKGFFRTVLEFAPDDDIALQFLESIEHT